jgi:hypothetical protein
MDITVLTRLVNEGLSQRKIAEAMSTSQSNVRYHLRKLNLKTKAATVTKHTHCNRCGKVLKTSRRTCGPCWTSIRRHKIKEKAVKYLGGSCSRCGYSKCAGALDFHHLRDKKFVVSRSSSCISWDKLKDELDKCELLCANCHREEHFKRGLS